ncbi:PREDICTED: tenascin-like [Vollenhovia emeryi]|uniref:tenascin-like n=1 Tax=Vollenhovia emeryi TaxID=411798 RepID=UPI0005F3C00B|nr:PREDICTED: tenascin-like [Vollenhovia emeryi]
MTALFRISFFLCSLAGYAFSQQDPPRTVAHVGDKCERDVDCIENAFCRWQDICLCDPFYSPSLDKSKCIATVGLSCLNNVPCQSIANGECKQNTCACKDDFFLDSSNSSNCISRPTKIGDRCQANTDVCQETFNYAFCISERCQCITGYHFVNETRVCVQSRALYFTCSHDYECYDGGDSFDTMECKKQQCVCKEGERCGGSSQMMAAGGILVAISLFLQRVAH